MQMVLRYLAIGAAGFVGAVLRVAVATAFSRWLPVRFPLATLFINISGSLFLGWFLTVIAIRYTVSETMRLAIGAGFVGAYTTFSTFMYESNALLEVDARFGALFNLLGSLALGLIAVKLGAIAARNL